MVTHRQSSAGFQESPTTENPDEPEKLPNRFFSTMEVVISQLEIGLQKLAFIRSLTAWPWMVGTLAGSSSRSPSGN